jgi:hypothetical protein
MRKKKAWFVAAVMLAVVSGAAGARAECGINSAGSTKCDDVKLGQLYVDSTGTYIETSGNEMLLSGSAATSCAPDSNIFLWLDRTHANYQVIMSTMISAKLANASVSIRVGRDTRAGMANRCMVLYFRFL